MAVLALMPAGCDDTAAPRMVIDLRIVSPSAGDTAWDLDPVVLIGEASTPAVGLLPDDSLWWTDNGDSIGRGRRVERRVTAGQHRLALHARYGPLRDSVERSLSVRTEGLGRVLWAVPLEDQDDINTQFESSGLSLTADGRLLARGRSGNVLVIAPDGSVELRYDLGFALSHAPPAIGPTGTAYYGIVGISFGPGFRGQLAWSPSEGLRWTFNIGDFGPLSEETPFGGSAVDAAENVYFATSTFDMPLWSTTRDGALRWRSATRPMSVTRSWGWVALVQDSLAVVMASYADSAVAVSTADGAVRWTVPVGSGWGSICRAAVAVGSGGTVYVPSSDGGVAAVGPSGQVIWPNAGGDTRFHAPVVGADAVYGAVLEGGAVRIRIPSAAVDTIGRVEGTSLNRGAGATLGRNDVLYVAGQDTLYSFAADGTRRFATPMAHRGAACWGFGDAPVIGADGTVYVRTTGGDGVVAFRDTVGPSTTAPWPTLQGNFQRTGRVATGT